MTSVSNAPSGPAAKVDRRRVPSESSGFPSEHDLDSLDSIPRMLDFASDRYGTRPAVRVLGEDRDISYSEVRQSVQAVIAHLDDLLESDTRAVGIVGEVSYPWVLAFLAVVCSGRVAVPVDAQLDGQTVAAMLDRAGASAALVDESVPTADLVAAGVTVADLSQIRRAAEAAPPQTSSLAEIHGHRVGPDTVALAVYTSGTAGVSKLVRLNHGNLMSNAVAGADSVVRHLPGEVVIVAVLPLHHLYGLNTTIVTALTVGATLCFGDGPRHFARDLTTFRPSVLVLVPMVVVALYRSIWREAERQGRATTLRRAIKVSNVLRRLGIDLRRRIFRSVHDSLGGRLSAIISGGAHLSPEYVARFADLGVDVVVGYGITECSPLVAANPPSAPRPGTVGRPVRGMQVRLVDGEVCVRGRGVMVGYDSEEATQAALDPDGWFRTGDRGSIDADGYLTITGRLKSLIILSDGNNVDPEEVEQALNDDPFVESSLVKGFHEGHREGLVAYVHPSSEADGLSGDEVTVRVEALVAEYNRSAPPFRRVYRTEVVAEPFSRTSLGKIKRYLYAEDDGSHAEPAAE